MARKTFCKIGEKSLDGIKDIVRKIIPGASEEVVDVLSTEILLNGVSKPKNAAEVAIHKKMRKLRKEADKRRREEESKTDEQKRAEIRKTVESLFPEVGDDEKSKQKREARIDKLVLEQIKFNDNLWEQLRKLDMQKATLEDLEKISRKILNSTPEESGISPIDYERLKIMYSHLFGKTDEQLRKEGYYIRIESTDDTLTYYDPMANNGTGGILEYVKDDSLGIDYLVDEKGNRVEKSIYAIGKPFKKVVEKDQVVHEVKKTYDENGNLLNIEGEEKPDLDFDESKEVKEIDVENGNEIVTTKYLKRTKDYSWASYMNLIDLYAPGRVDLIFNKHEVKSMSEIVGEPLDPDLVDFNIENAEYIGKDSPVDIWRKNKRLQDIKDAMKASEESKKQAELRSVKKASYLSLDTDKPVFEAFDRYKTFASRKLDDYLRTYYIPVEKIGGSRRIKIADPRIIYIDGKNRRFSLEIPKGQATLDFIKRLEANSGTAFGKQTIELEDMHLTEDDFKDLIINGALHNSDFEDIAKEIAINSEFMDLYLNKTKHTNFDEAIYIGQDREKVSRNLSVILEIANYMHPELNLFPDQIFETNSTQTKTYADGRTVKFVEKKLINPQQEINMFKLYKSKLINKTIDARKFIWGKHAKFVFGVPLGRVGGLKKLGKWVENTKNWKNVSSLIKSGVLKVNGDFSFIKKGMSFPNRRDLSISMEEQLVNKYKGARSSKVYGKSKAEIIKDAREISALASSKKYSDINDMFEKNPGLIKFFKDVFPNKIKDIKDILEVDHSKTKNLTTEDYRFLSARGEFEFNDNLKWKHVFPELEHLLNSSESRLLLQKKLREDISKGDKMSPETAETLFGIYGKDKNSILYEKLSLNTSSDYVRENLNGGYYSFEELSGIAKNLLDQKRKSMTEVMTGLKNREKEILLEFSRQKAEYAKMISERKQRVEDIINFDPDAEINKEYGLSWAESLLKQVLEEKLETRAFMDENGDITKKIVDPHFDASEIRLAVEKKALADLAEYSEFKTIRDDLTLEEITKIIGSGVWDSPEDFIKELQIHQKINENLTSIKRAQMKAGELFSMAAKVEVRSGVDKNTELTKEQHSQLEKMISNDIEWSYDDKANDIKRILEDMHSAFFAYSDINKKIMNNEYSNENLNVEHVRNLIDRFALTNPDFYVRPADLNSAIEIRKLTLSNYNRGSRMEIIFDRESKRIIVEGIKLFINGKDSIPKIMRTKLGEISLTNEKNPALVEDKKLRSFVINDRLSELEKLTKKRGKLASSEFSAYMRKRGIEGDVSDVTEFVKQIKKVDDLNFVIDKLKDKWETVENKNEELVNNQERKRSDFIKDVSEKTPELVKTEHNWDTSELSEIDKAKFMARSNLINSTFVKHNIHDYKRLLEITSETKSKAVYKTGSPNAFDLSAAKDRTKISLFGNDTTVANFEVVKNKYDGSYNVFVSDGGNLYSKMNTTIPKGNPYYEYAEELFNYHTRLVKGEGDLKSSEEISKAVENYSLKKAKEGSLNLKTNKFLRENKITQDSTSQEKLSYAEKYKDLVLDETKHKFGRMWDGNKKRNRLDLKSDINHAIDKKFEAVWKLRDEIISDLEEKGESDDKRLKYYKESKSLSEKNNSLLSKINDGTVEERSEISKLEKELQKTKKEWNKTHKEISKRLKEERKTSEKTGLEFYEYSVKERDKGLNPISKKSSDLESKIRDINKGISKKFWKEIKEINSNKEKIDAIEYKTRTLKEIGEKGIENKVQKANDLIDKYNVAFNAAKSYLQGDPVSERNAYIEDRATEITKLLNENYKLFGTNVKKFSEALHKVSIALTGAPNNLARLFEADGNYELADALLKMLAQEPAGTVEDTKSGKKIEITRPLDKEWVDSQRKTLSDQTEKLTKKLENNDDELKAKEKMVSEYELKLSDLEENDPEYNETKALLESAKDDISYIEEENDDIHDKLLNNKFLHGLVSSLGTPERVRAFINVFNHYVREGKFRKGRKAIVPIVDQNGNNIGETTHMYGQPLKNVVDPFKIIKDIEGKEGKEEAAEPEITSEDIQKLINELTLDNVEIGKVEVKSEKDAGEADMPTEDENESYDEESSTAEEETTSDGKETDTPEYSEETSDLTDEQISKLREYHRVHGPDGVKILYEERAGGEISKLEDLTETDMATVGVTVNKINAIYKHNGEINDLTDVDSKQNPDLRKYWIKGINDQRGTYSLGKNEDIVVPLSNLYELVSAVDGTNPSSSKRINEVMENTKTSRPYDEEVDYDDVENNTENDAC